MLQFFPTSQIENKPENFILSKEIFRAIRRIKKMCDHFPISALIKEMLNPKTLIIDNVADWNSFKKLFTDYNDLIADLAIICNKKVTLTNAINSNQLKQLASFFNTITICIESKNDQITVAEKNNVDQIEIIIDCLSYISSIQPKQENSKAPIDMPGKSDKESVEHVESNYDNIPTIKIDWSKAETLHLSAETLNKIIEKPVLHKLIPNHISSLYLKTKHFTNKIPLKIDTLLAQIKSTLALNPNNILTLDQIDLLCTIKDIPVLHEQLKTEFSDKTVRIGSCIGQDWPGTIDVIAPLFKKVEIAIQDYKKTENKNIFNTRLNHNNVILMFIDNVNLFDKSSYDNFFKNMVEKSEKNKWILNWDQCKRISLNRYDTNVETIAFIKKISNKEILYELYLFDKKIVTFTSDMNNIDLPWEPLKEDSTTFLLTDLQLQAINALDYSLGLDTARIKKILKTNFPNAQTLRIEKKINQYYTNYFALLCSFFQKILIQAKKPKTINTLFEGIIDLIPSNDHHKVTLSMPQKFQFNESTNAKLHNNNLITVEEGLNTILITKDEYHKICEGLIPIHKIDDRCIFNLTNPDHTTPQQITAKDIKSRAKPIQQENKIQQIQSIEQNKSSDIAEPSQQRAEMQIDQHSQSGKSEDKSVEKDKSSNIINPKQLISKPTTQPTIKKPIQQEGNMQIDQHSQSGKSKKKSVKQDALSYINRIYTFLSNKIISYKKLTVGCYIGIGILLISYIDLPACFTY